MKYATLWRQRILHMLQKIWKDEKQRNNLLLCAGLTGMLLLAVSAWLPEGEKASPEAAEPQTDTAEAYAAALESRLEELIRQVDGAGRTRVMVTLQTGEESIYATDNDVAADGTSSTSHVLVGGDALLETVATPQVLGVAVVCEGGGEAAVQNRVSTLVETLTGVGAHHITVAKMAPTN
ncbi:stage III sporulation protein AG [uncultured Subdoligranulum sp.]|mgnify:CR=1 FL=1|uniref:Stage III sporulation protein AG n=1 Tax=Candidatus Gemmiger excrementavium TaxID=2838608 RepID=A0A9D2JGE6_9FIRM|nr:stage III sporulation protein AG [uncultured Subdoligranulum sp.]HIZ47724.1 stage III sporulation protein AG [Candidatus Gemmiger excrementavium]